MSGVEAAGLVLASIPLVISALDQYANGVETIARWWRYRAELLALSNTLCAENTRLIFTCERLLRDLVPEDMLDVFTADSSLWKNAFLEGKLCERLKSSHSIFLKLIGDTNEALKELQSRLKLDGEWKVRY